MFDDKQAKIIAGCCAYTALAIAIVQIIQHLRHYSEPLFQRYIVRIIFMIPVYSMASFPSLLAPSNSIYWVTVRDCYEAWVIYNFMSLCLAYVGGPGAVEIKMAGFVLMPNWVSCTCCMPPMPVNGRFVRLTKQMTLQFVLFKPIMAVLTIILYATGNYEEGNWAPSNGYLWITIVYNITYTVALYGLLLFYMGTHELLAPFKPLLKFILVKSVIFLTYWQGLFVVILEGAGVINSREDAINFQNWLLCIEMLPAAICMLFAFPYDEYKVAGPGMGLSGGNVTHAISIRDVVSDTVHQFAPAYHDYVLYSDGGSKPVPPKTGAAGPVRTRTFMAVGQESVATHDRADLLMNMELGGISTWQRSDKGPPAPGHTADVEAPGQAEMDPHFSLTGSDHEHDDHFVESPMPVGKSKYLKKEDEPSFSRNASHAEEFDRVGSTVSIPLDSPRGSSKLAAKLTGKR